MNNLSTEPRVHQQRRTIRRLLALMTGLIVAGVGIGAVAAPTMDPGPLHPHARLLNYKIDQVSRIAYVRAHLDMGYVLTAPIDIDAAE